MTAVTSAQLANVLKRHFTPTTAESLIFGSQDRWIINNFKDMVTGGDYETHAVHRETSQGIAANFLVAQTNSGQPTVDQFRVTPPAAGLHGVMQIDTDLLLRTKEERSAFLKDRVLEFDDIIEGLSDFVEQTLIGDGTGVKGQVANTSFATTAMTLVDTSDAINFHENEYIVFAATSTGALLDSGQSIKVTGVNLETGVITLAENLSEITAIATNSYIFREGTAANGSTRVLPYGLDGWLPSTAPTSGDSFYNVDRSANPTKLAGVRTTGLLGDIYGAVNDAAALVKSYGRKVQKVKVLTSHVNVGRLSKQANIQVQQMPGGRGKMGFSGVTIYTTAGEVEVYGSPFVKSSVMYMLDVAVCQILYLGGSLVYVWDLDGKMLQRLPSGSGVEVRVESRPAIRILKPGNCARIAMAQ